jgi:hypothetical protein
MVVESRNLQHHNQTIDPTDKFTSINLFKILWVVTWATVTDLVNSCVTPLFRRPQGSYGCLEKRNYPLSWNLVVWCAKIGHKTNKVQKTSELTQKMSKMMDF